MAGEAGLLERTKRSLRSVLVSKKGGVAVDLLERDYRELVGSGLPCRALGFASMSSLLAALPDVCAVVRRGGQPTVVGVADADTAHDKDMVDRQAAMRQGSRGRTGNVRNIDLNQNIVPQLPLSGHWDRGDVEEFSVPGCGEAVGLEEAVGEASPEPPPLGELEMEQLKQLVVRRPLLSESELTILLREEVGLVLAAGMVSRLAEDGVVDLERATGGGNGNLNVRPSLRTLREVKRRSVSPMPSMGTSICTKVEVQELPHHLKEGRFFTLVVTQVKDPENFWFMVYDECGGHFEAVQAAMDDMEQFYSGVEGDRWRVTSVKQCPPGTVLAATYRREGLHRVIVREVVDLKNIKVFYLDHGTTDVVRLKNVRWLVTAFGGLPAQALRAGLCGVEPPAGISRWPPAARALVIQLTDAEPGAVVAQVRAGVERRSRKVVGEGRLLRDRGLTLQLVNVGLGLKGTDVSLELVREGLARREGEGGSNDVTTSTATTHLQPEEVEQGTEAERLLRAMRSLKVLCRQAGLGEEEAALMEALGGR